MLLGIYGPATVKVITEYGTVIRDAGPVNGENRSDGTVYAGSLFSSVQMRIYKNGGLL